MTPIKIALARQMYDAKQHSLAEIARTLGVSRASIYRHISGSPPTDRGRHQLTLAEFSVQHKNLSSLESECVAQLIVDV